MNRSVARVIRDRAARAQHRRHAKNPRTRLARLKVGRRVRFWRVDGSYATEATGYVTGIFDLPRVRYRIRSNGRSYVRSIFQVEDAG